MNMEVDIPTKSSSANVNAKARQFGTLLTANIVNQRPANKRTFNEYLGEEHNEKENTLHDEENPLHPAKRRRINERSEGTEQSGTKQRGQCPINGDPKPRNQAVVADRVCEQEGEQRAPNNKCNTYCSQRMETLINPIQIPRFAPKQELQIIVEIEPLSCDAANKDDDLCVPTYAREIYAWFRHLEVAPFQQSLIEDDYISSAIFQPDLSRAMRVILLDWLFNVHRKFELKPRVMSLVVYILDAYLSRVPVKRSELQLVGCTALWIASKYHEIYSPAVTDFVYVSDHLFEIEDLSNTEVLILVKLEFKILDIMTPYHFLERYLQIASFPLRKKYESRGTADASNKGKRYAELVSEIANFFVNLILFDCKTVSTAKPSCIAAAAICFTVLGISLYSQWPNYLIKATGYQHHELKPVLQRMDKLRKSHIDKTKNAFCSLKTVHESIQKWLGQLNAESALNNGADNSESPQCV